MITLDATTGLGDELLVEAIETILSETTNMPYTRAKLTPVLKELYTDDGKLIKRTLGKTSAFEIYNEGKAPEVGTFIGGIIKSFKTSPYKIGENTVSSITVVVATGDNAIEVANKRLERNRASVLGNDGKPTKVYADVVVPPAVTVPPVVTDAKADNAAKAAADKALAGAGPNQ